MCEEPKWWHDYIWSEGNDHGLFQGNTGKVSICVLQAAGISLSRSIKGKTGMERIRNKNNSKTHT
jgi:hypothetical protein